MKETQAIIKENNGENEVIAVNFPFNNGIAEVTMGNDDVFYAIGETRISNVFNKNNEEEHKLFKNEAKAMSKAMAMIIIGFAKEIANETLQKAKENGDC